MQAAGQTGGRSSSPLSRPKSNSERPPSPGHSASGGSKKRDRSHKSVDSSKRQNSSKNQDIGGLVDKDGGVLNCAGIAQLYRLMQQDLNKSSRRFKEVASRRTSLAAVIAATDREDCLNKFVQLGGLPLLNHWLQDAHKGKLGDGGSSNDGDKFIDDLILTLLQALGKLPVDLHALESCNAGRSVKNLRSHKNSKIHKAAKKLVEDWKQRVDAEFMNQSEETKIGSKQDIGWSCKPMPKNSAGYLKNGGSAEGSSRSGAFGSTVKKATATSVPALGEPAISFKKGGTALPGKGALVKESPGNMQSGNAPVAEIDGSSVPDERSSNSNQPLSNGVMWSSTPAKNTVSNWKEDLKSSVNNTANMKSANTKAGASRSHVSSKGIPGVGLNEGSKEVGSGKPPVRSTSSAGIDKNYNASGAFDKASNESSKVEGCSNNQRLILRLPNTARNPIGNTIPDGTAPTSRDSSSNFADRNLDSSSRKSRSQAVCMEDGAIKTAISRHDGIEKPVDLPGRRNEMDCPSSDSHLSFGSTDCCAADFKTNSIYQEGQPVDERRPDVLTQTHQKSNGCGTVDVNVGICLLASIAADENLRIEKDAASAAFEKIKHTKEGESQHREMKTCLTDSENSPLSGITENSGRMDLVPDPDVKNGQDNNSECLRPGSDEGMQNLGIAATSTDVDMGQSNETMIKTSEGLPLAQRFSEGRLEGGCGEGKSGDSQNVTARSPPGKSPDDNRSKDYEDPPDLFKDRSPPREIGSEDKKNPLFRAAASMDTSPLPGRYGKSGGEEKDEKKFCSNDTATESTCRFPGEDALEVAMQVAKEVEQEMQSYEKISLEKESNLEANSTHRDVVMPTDHPESELSQEQKLKSTELLKNDEKDDAGNQESLRGANIKQHLKPEDERLDLLENKESEQSTTAYPSCNDKKQPSSGFEGFDGSLDDGHNELKQADELRHPTPSADEAQRIAEVELCSEPEAPGKIDFDLNEGILSEESPHEITATAAVSYPVASVPITPVASHPVISSSLSTPIPVFAATKGAFIPPVSPHWGKGELGWKGSAATSAFRPAEPRKTPERCAIVTQSGTPDVTTGLVAKPARQFLDFDLNIADEGLAEDFGRPAVQTSSASRLNLDLNRVDDSEENGGAVLASETVKNEAQSSSSTSKAIKHDFDLNRGLNMDDTAADDPADSRKISHVHGYAGLPLAGFKMGGEMLNLPPWTQAGSPFASVPMPAFSSMRHETPFSGSVPHAFFGVGQGQCTPFHPDILSSGSAFPYRTPSPPSFPYGGYPFGYSSAPFPAVPASFLDASGPQFLTSTAVLPSNSRPPYLMGFPDIAAASNSAESWATRSLDLNAGPELADSDTRDERAAVVRQAPAFGNPLFLGEQIAAFRQSAEAADLLKRKEPEGGWDVYRAGLKQATRR